MFDPRDRYFGRGVDQFSDDAVSADLFARWGNGVVFASIPFVVGILALAHQTTWCLRTRPVGLVRYFDSEATAWGIMYLSLGVFMHGHYFWSVSRRFYWLSELLKYGSLLGVIGSVAYTAIRTIVFA